MSSFDEYRKKLREKYGVTSDKSEDEQEKKKQTIDGSSVWDDSFESYKKKLNAKYGSDMDAEGVKNWFSESESTLQSMSDYYKANDGKWVSNFGSDFAGKLDELINTSHDVGFYLRNNKRSFADYDSVSKALSEYRSFLEQYKEQNSAMAEFYSQFDTEDIFNEWKKNYDLEQQILGADDFEEYSQKGASIDNPTMDEAEGSVVFFGKRFGAKDIGNIVTYSRENVDKLRMGEVNGSDLLGDSRYSHMTDNEVNIYNYYLAKHGKLMAYAYLDSIDDTLNQREAGRLAESFDDNAFLEAIMGFSAGIESSVQGLKGLDDFFTGNEPGIDFSANQYADQIVASNNEGVLKGFHDVSSAIGAMLPSILVGSLTGNPLIGAATLGTSAIGNGYAEMRRLGYDEWQSRGYGLLVGASETALQYALGGIGKLGGKLSGNVIGKFVSTFDNALARTAIKLGGNMASEGLEEAIQTVLEPAFKSLVTGEEFDAPKWEEIWYSALLGALSAGVLEGVPTIAGTAWNSAKTSMAYNGNLGKTYDVFGKKIANPQTKADKIALKTELRNDLVNEALEIDPDNAHAQRMKARLEGGKGVSGYQLNRIFEANEQALVKQDKAKMKTAAEARLTELGETGDIGNLADVIVKDQLGEPLTKKERTLLKNSENGQTVSKELDPETINSGEHTTKWAENLGTERVNTEAYSKGLYDLATEKAGVAVDEGKDSVTKNPTAKENATEVKFEASTDGKTRVGDTEVTIKEIASVKDGEVMLRLEDDSTVNARDVDLASADEVILYENVADMNLNAATANAFVKGYDPSMSVQEYVLGFREAYRYGEYGFPVQEMSQKGFSSMLSESQKSLAYNLGKTDSKYKVESKQAKIDSIGAIKSEKIASKGKKKGKLHNTLTPTNERQRASLKTLGVLAEALGIDIYTFESPLVNGKRQGKNGWFDPKDGSIHIDLYAGASGEGTMLFTVAHELTHFIREQSPSKFKVFADSLLEQYGNKGVPIDALVRAQIEKAKNNGRDISYDTAYEEVIADSCEAMLADGDVVAKIAELKAKDKTLWQKIKDFLTNLVARIKAAYDGMSPDSAEGRYVAEMLDTAERLKALWTEALVEASDNYTSAEKTLLDNGIVVDSKTESASLMSVRDILDSKQQQKVATALAERFGVTVEEAKGWISAETSLASLILNPKYSQYLDYTADPSELAIKSNSDYPQGTVDFSNICKKRRDFTEVMNRVLRNFPNHVFEATDLAKIRTIMMEEKMEVACGICYVEDRRQLDSIVAQNFIDSLGLYRSGSKMRPDGKAFNTNQLKALNLIDGDTYTPSIYELISLEGRNALKAKNPAMEEAWVKFNNARGMQSVRLLLNDAEYKRQILKYSPTTVKSKNNLGGLRIYSFSDMEMFHLIDIIQVITDSATVGLSLQGYTKVNEYAKAVKDTGEKLNRSLIPKGELGYHIENGKVVLDFDTIEGIDINHEDFFDNIDNPNIGNIVIGINREQIRAAMVNKFIDQIIPFHTGQSNEVLGEKGIGSWVNYKDFQSEIDLATGKKASHQINIYTEVIEAAAKEGKPITNKVDFVNKFLQVCKENNLQPRFSEFLNVDENGDYVYTEGYHKFLVDFKTFDQNTGEYLPQMPVKPIFDNDYLTGLLKGYVKSQKVKDAEVAKAMPKVLDRITKEIVGADVKFSDRDSDGNALSKEQKDFFKDSKVRDRNGNLLVVYHGTANGGAFTIFDGDKLSNSSLTTQIGQGFYFTNVKKEAEAYMKNSDIYGKVSKGNNPHLHKAYLNISNPFYIGKNQLDLDKAKSVYSDGTYDYFFNNWIPFYLDKKTVNGRTLTKADVQSMSKTEKVSEYVDYLDSLGVKDVLSNMVRAFPYGKQGELLSAMKKHLGYDGIIEEFLPNQYQFVAFSPEQIKSVDNKNPTSNPDIRYSDRDSSYMDAVKRGDMETAQKMVDDVAKEAGYNSPKLYHGTKMFGFTEVKTSGVEKGVAWSPFFATNREDISASYVPYGKVRDISSSMDDDAIEEARETAIEERKENIIDLVYDFRRLIDRHFSPWVFGQAGNSYLERLVEKANPEAGNGDGVYDVLSEIVYDSFYHYQDAFGEYEDADDWSENSPEGQEIFSKIVEIEGEKSALHNLESGEELGGIYQLYANLDNMYVVDGKGVAWNELRPEGLPKIDRYGVKDVPYRTRDVAEWARENGFDGVIFKNIRDNGAYGRTPAGDVYAFFRPESQIKSADPVTYDANGEVIPLSERFKSENNDIRYSFRNSESGTANDALSPYNYELARFIQQKGDYIVDNFAKLEQVVNLAFDNPSIKATAYFGIVNEETLEKIKNSIPNLPKAIEGILFKEGRDYSIATTLDAVRHIVDDKSLSREDVIDYLDRFADTIMEFDSVAFNYYVKGKDKIPALLFKKRYSDGTLVSFDLVSNKKRSIVLQTLYMDSADYQKKKSAETLLMQNAVSNTSKTQVGQTSIDIIPQDSKSVKREFSDADIKYSIREEGLSEADKEVAYNVISRLKEQKTFAKYYRSFATYTEKRINDEISWSMAQHDPDYAQTYITWVNPIDYIYATTATEAWREQLAKEAGSLDKEKLAKETQPIYLTVDFETGKIKGHEGRHRMIALEKAGVEKVAVIIISRNDQYWKTKPIEVMHLEGQDFGDYKRGTDFFLHNMLPLSERYADVAREMFSFDTTDGVRFSNRDPDSVSNRSLLANALETVAQNDVERNKLKQYKAKIDLINSEQAKLQELREKIKELSFAKGPRDAEAIKSLQFEANQAANRITTYDKQLLSLESTKALKDVLEREKQMAYKRAEQRGKDALAAYRERATKTQRELMTRYQESRKKGVENRHKTAMRHKIKDVVNELNQYLLKGTKDKHVPIELQKAVAEALDAVNMDTVGAEERIAKKQAEMRVAKSFEEMQKLSKEIEHIQEMGGNMDAKLSRLKTAYDSIIKSDDPLIANSHDEVISNTIDKVIEVAGNTPLRDMSLYQLESVYDLYKMVLTSVRNANKAFKAKKKEEISVIANRVIEEIDKVGKKRLYRTKAEQAFSKFDWNNLKPVYAFERIGSDTFTEVFNNVRAGEDTWAVDITEAKEFSAEQRKKFKYDSWDFKKRYSFTSSSGMKFELSLDQIMSLYAYSKREQAKDHLKKGGIVFDETTEVTIKNKLGIPIKFNPTQATAYNLSDETLVDIIGKLTEEQRSFVDAMQDYLSTTMGDKGNEVSLALYGVKLYKEKNYFPLKSASQFMAKAKEQQKGEVKIKNSGFSKETAPKASNPIVLTPFMDVWADHVNEMSMYHAFVLPLEDFYRVFNYKTPTSDTMATESVEMYLQNAYGKGATQYIDQLLKDLNGGARVDPTAGIINKLTGLFKKSAVFASLSVVVQQPSAIARATAIVDTKYFVGKPLGKHKTTWAEVKKYAPVAVIKEMGYFDTGMGQSTVEWIKDDKTWKNKVDDVASKAPALADEYAWCAIWNAVKRETLHTHKDLKPNSEEFLNAVGERFTEVITKTQVYDSVLARSANMRSKDTGMKMATAFMGEPTTSINMLENALIQGKRGNKRYARKAVGSVAASMILNSILVSLVYAGRDDDEEKSYAEKYISTLAEELLDSANPLSLIPFVKDIVSIAQGYDVERSDMAVITDLIKAWNNLSNDNRSAYRKVEDFAGAVASIFGLPLKNIMRDARGMYNTVDSFINGEKTTGAGMKNAIIEAITGKVKSNGQQLYEAMVNGDTAQIERVKGRFKDQNAINSAIRTALRENDPRIKEAAQARYNGDIAEYMRIAKAIIAEGHFKQDDVVSAINTEINLLKKGEGTSESSDSKVKSMYEVSDYYAALVGRDEATAYVVKEDIIKTGMANGKDRDEAEDAFNSSFVSHLRSEHESGGLSDYEARNMLVKYGGKTEEEAHSKVRYWNFKQEYPDYDLSESAVTAYYEEVEPSGIKVGVYYDYCKRRTDCKGTDNNGDGRTDSGSVKAQVMNVINSLPITNAQKDALYYLNGWSASTIYEAPWH